jgi:hypothetical protein
MRGPTTADVVECKGLAGRWRRLLEEKESQDDKNATKTTPKVVTFVMIVAKFDIAGTLD